MKILFVVNPKSGSGGQNLETIISQESRKTGFKYSIYRLKKDNTSQELKQEIANYSPDILAVAGGDGTVNLISSIIAHSDIALLIIPAGSANGMAKEIGINNIQSAFRLLENGVRKQIDLLKVNNLVCIHLSDVGLNAKIVKRFEQDPKRGILTYAKHLLAEVFLIKQYRFIIRLDDKEIRRKAVSLTFANASSYGTGFVINPIGKLDDGKFEIVIIKPFPTIKIFSIAWKMLKGTLLSSEYAEVVSCSRVSVLTSRRTTLQIDGEVIGKTRQITVEIAQKALTILAPPNLDI